MPLRANVRTINGNKHNTSLAPKFQRVQNRAAAILDAWNPFGESHSLELIAHLHSLKVEQIRRDLYGDPCEIEKRFGTDNTDKIERVLYTCLKELDENVHPTLVAIANHVPFTVIHILEDSRDVEQVAAEFLDNNREELREIRRKKDHDLFESIDRTVWKKELQFLVLFCHSSLC